MSTTKAISPTGDSMLATDDVLVHNFVWHGNTCTVGRTNFVGFLSLAGVKAVFEVDPDAQLSRRILTLTELYATTGAGEVPDFTTVEGNERYFKMLHESGCFSPDFTLYARYEVECSVDSPLIGWFLVLGAKDGRSGLSYRWEF